MVAIFLAHLSPARLRRGPRRSTKRHEAEAAPAAFDEEDATRLARKMKVDELRAALEVAGADTEEQTGASRAIGRGARRGLATTDGGGSDATRPATATAARRQRRPGRREAAPAAFDEEEAAAGQEMKVEEPARRRGRGRGHGGTSCSSARGPAAPPRPRGNSGEYGEAGYDSDEGYPVEEGDDIAVGARLLGKFSGDGRYYMCGRGDREGRRTPRSTMSEKNRRGSTCATTPPSTTLRRRRRGYFVEVVEGAALLGRKSDDGQYHNVMVEEVTEAGGKVLLAEFGDDEQTAELPIEHLRYPYAAEEERATRGGRLRR